MAHFDERSGIVPCKTKWGSWWQTIEEVFIEVDPGVGTELSGKEIKCTIKPKSIALSIQGNVVFEGELFEHIHADEAIWTLEDKRYVRICLSKAHDTAAHCWPSLLVGQYQVDPMTFDEMQKKLTLQRFQFEVC
ncbi:NudC domain-containing protein 2-like [Elysia marginata]|uniref:NudC domain-containing protein 2-like n=1 Tax=Elysia marginata TaxID=1093978 RepID=A0AAV4II77_9GAST|nr:NudC domain-containing protein 2-like [Elysia marginata]